MTSAAALLMLAALTLTGCTSEASNIGVAKNKENHVVDTGFSVSTVGSFDSADTAVVLSTDAANKAVSFVNMETGKQYTLYYDGTTYVKDKYEGPMTISQIKAGDIVDVTFLKGKKKLASIQKSPKAWIYDGISNYDLAGANKTASIGSKTYSLPAGVVVLSDGRRMGTEEVVSQDEVTISGIDHKIYSVNVDRGHGYLRLKNDQPLLGGWIEVGNRVIRQITEDMLLTVPEGSYQVVLDNNGIGCVKEITVERDKEVVLDVGDVEIAEDKTGIILFEVTPASAKISVDGKPIETGTAVELRYGIHQVVIEASGYDTLTRYIQVGSERAAISFTLEESRKSDKNDNSVSGNTAERIPWQDTLDTVKKDSVSKNDTLSQNALTTANNNKVYVDSPKGVEVYLDGNYVGIAPVRFTKTAGRHEITLKKSGYKTKSYTIYLENNKKDETYSFSDLEKEKGSSDNTDDDNTDDKKPTSSGGTTGEPPLPEATIPKEIVSAVTGINDLVFTDGIEVMITDGVGELNDKGKEALNAAIKKAVESAVDAKEAQKYTYGIQNSLSNLKQSDGGDGRADVTVTIFRSGYKEQNTSVNIEIRKNKSDEITVTVSPESAQVEQGGSLQFNAEVHGDADSDAAITWTVSSESDGTAIDGNGLLTVSKSETAENLTVKATHERGNQTASGTATVTIKEKMEPPKEKTVTFVLAENSETIENSNDVEITILLKEGDEPKTCKLREAIILPYGTYKITVKGYCCESSEITVDEGTEDIQLKLTKSDT